MMMVPRKNGFNIFDEVFNDPFFTKKENKLMKTDVREKDGNYVLEIDLPGYNKEDIRIDLTDGYLTVTAKREENKEEKDLFDDTTDEITDNNLIDFYQDIEKQKDEDAEVTD